jgi:D-alanyl-D-alanine carboxypeptidase (penicillin-binding protein 5/6)
MLSRRILLAGTAVALPALALAQTPPQTPAQPAPRPAQRPLQRNGQPRGRPPREPVPTGSPAATPIGPLDTAARWAVILDYTTGATLLDKEADAPMPPSSMAKLMTMYIVYSMLKSGRLQLTQELPVSERAWRMQGSKMFVGIGSQVKVEDLIRGVIVQSGNDACIVFAEALAGSEDQFADLMNQKAKELGLQHSTFRNATGMPDPDQRMSARDIALLARRIIQDFPEYYKYDAEREFKYNNINQQNRNPLVQKGLADGLKTGHTDEGGYGLVASAQRGGRRVIMVINGLTSMHQRAEEGERLLEWAFREFEDVTLFTAADTVEQAPVWLGTAPSVPLVGGRDLVVTMPRGWRTRAKIAIQYDSPIPAPITRGSTLGRLVVSGQGVPEFEVPLLAGTDVPRLGLPGRALAVLSHYVTGS